LEQYYAKQKAWEDYFHGVPFDITNNEVVNKHSELEELVASGRMNEIDEALVSVILQRLNPKADTVTLITSISHMIQKDIILFSLERGSIQIIDSLSPGVQHVIWLIHDKEAKRLMIGYSEE
jgi:hypothetical protein